MQYKLVPVYPNGQTKPGRNPIEVQDDKSLRHYLTLMLENLDNRELVSIVITKGDD